MVIISWQERGTLFWFGNQLGGWSRSQQMDLDCERRVRRLKRAKLFCPFSCWALFFLFPKNGPDGLQNFFVLVEENAFIVLLLFLHKYHFFLWEKKAKRFNKSHHCSFLRQKCYKSYILSKIISGFEYYFCIQQQSFGVGSKEGNTSKTEWSFSAFFPVQKGQKSLTRGNKDVNGWWLCVWCWASVVARIFFDDVIDY